ncbi:hypothetical protein WN51_11102 [Melipona quadrifasciata]|uniref:Uncharacterized protein n=1 Tax=Melipona quadrifasciata TaxID=166423 RepID=A0A0M9A3Z1_9HYME|nr:hypothetical protein WN51_11102 [Melipona quadrifasciata]
MAILQDHLLVPSRTICSACSRLSMCVSGSTENVVLKRRQCPRHRIVLRQPLVPVSVSANIPRLKRLARPLAFLEKTSRGGTLQRPPKDVVKDCLEAEVVDCRENVVIQQRRRFSPN